MRMARLIVPVIVGALATRQVNDLAMPSYRCHGYPIVLGTSELCAKVLVEAAKSRRAYVILSASYRTSPEGARVAAPILLAAYGPDRLLSDSDWPHT